MRNKCTTFFAICVFLLSWFSAQSQELNCRVQILSPQVQISDKRVFTTLETSIREFMNNQKWTSDDFKRDEKIELNLTFTINTYNLPDEMKGNLQVQVRRPVYNTNYGTLLFNHQDNDIEFRYLEYQPIEFSTTAFLNNLSSILGFYAYLAIALDYDSFAFEGGTPFYQIAQQVCQQAQPTSIKGWMSNEIPPRNRFWMVENMLSPPFKPMREAFYKYHRLGLDVMYNNIAKGRTEINQSLTLLKKVNDQRPASFNLQLFFNAKTDELINVYKQAELGDKTFALELLNQLDPTNGSKYNKINQ